MRWVKYRAWQPDAKEIDGMDMRMWSWREIRETSLDEILNRKDEFILMQYTGFQDKNGIDIYEGDIIRYTFDLPDSLHATENGLKVRTGKVFWSDWRGSFAVGNNLANNDLFKYIRNGNRVEVIGNIYENPELMGS
jgi:uncharacterized phage protein (TIGR01671 family)